MSVLVNGSPTEEISIRRGLKQGDPLAPHLFLLVAEGLGALMRKAVEIERFQPFRVGRDRLPVSILQYADDTLCVGEATVENLWTLKAVLRGFEFASGLRVNFWKSSIIGVNVPNDFMAMAANFLNCRIGKTPFKYLGLPVGANPRLMSTWKPMIDVIRGRIGSWGNKYLSFGGRIVMLNAVLNAIPIFYLSYLKMPTNVWREVVRLQRKFLWGGVSNRRKINWVKWEEVCKPKKEGGLGVRDLRLTNLSLLAKWRWKLLQPEEEFWKSIVSAKYGNGVVGVCNLGEEQLPRSASSWWYNICKLDNNTRWFELGVVKVLGNGSSTSFWNDIWVGDQNLASMFPRLFAISNQQHLNLSDMGGLEVDGWRWRLLWRRPFFIWEEAMYMQLVETIRGFQPVDRVDSWRWIHDPQSGFTAKSAYHSLVSVHRQQSDLNQLQRYVFNNIWISGAPSKVSAFSWQLLLNRIPTLDNLLLRGFPANGNLMCSLCNGYAETAGHLFLNCEITAKIWYDIVKWIGFQMMLPPTLNHSFAIMANCGKGKRGKKGMMLIWHAFIWTVWRLRNNRIFNNGVIDAEEAVETIKRLSWQWFIGRLARSPCLFYEWRWDPGDCFAR
jgi:hypothetical protein